MVKNKGKTPSLSYIWLWQSLSHGRQKAEEVPGHTKSHFLPRAKGIWLPNISAKVVSLHSLYLSLAVLDNKWPESLREIPYSHTGCLQCQQQAGHSPQALVCHAQVSCLHISLIFRTSLSIGGAIKSGACCGLGFFPCFFLITQEFKGSIERPCQEILSPQQFHIS